MECKILMTIHGLLSDVGHGKTLLAVLFLAMDWRAGIKIISNVPGLKIPHEDFDPDILRDKSRWHELDDKSILIDEIDSIADNRRSMSKDNISVSSLAWFHRKARVHIYYTSHQLNLADPNSLRSVDARISEYTNHFWLPTATRIHPLYVDETPLFIDVDWIGRNARGGLVKLGSFTVKQEKIIEIGQYYDTGDIPFNPMLGNYN